MGRPDGRLTGKVAAITGAAQGLGAAYARAFAAAGASVCLADIGAADAVAEEITEAGGAAIAVPTDVADAASCEAMVARTVAAFGGLDILVNNAALFAALARRGFAEIDIDEWDRVMAVNVRGPFLCARAAVPAMRRRGGGKIVNVASTTVMKGVPGALHYVTSKGAAIAMTRAMARELGDDNICVNALAPGLTLSDGVADNRDTFAPYLELSRRGRALKRDQVVDDLVGAALFFASADSDFVTGQTLVIDGGDAMY